MNAIVISDDGQVYHSCEYISRIVGVDWRIEENIVDFLLALQQNSFDLILFDCEKFGDEALKWLQHVHQLRPRIPIITTCPCVTRQSGASLLATGILFLAEKPLDDQPLVEVIQKLKKGRLNPSIHKLNER